MQAAERGYTVDELWAIARRRAPVALAVAAVVTLVGAVGAFATPDEFRAEAVIILEPHRPHAELVTPAVTTMLEDRLRVARQQLLARPLLEKVVQDLNLYPELRREEGLAAAVARLRARLDVHPDGESAVAVGYRTPLQGEAAPVVAAVAGGYATANASLRTGQSRRVLDILSEELSKVTARLDEREKAARDFKRAHDGELPEQAEGNLREAERMTRLLDSTQSHLRDLERRRAMAPDRPVMPEVERLSAMESDLVRQLNHARSIYSDDHPEPQRLEREVEGLRALRDGAEQRLLAARQEKDMFSREITRARTEAAALERQIREARGRAAAAAKWAMDLGIIERDRELLREKYRSLVSRKVEGEVALGLEERGAPLSTHVVDPAATPVRPAGPDRPRLLLVSLLLGLGLGAGAALLLESRDRTLRSPAQAREALGVPLLATLPRIGG
jgi:uncharacterized protein involved in exopolysaccharide biosynthesis